MSDLIEQVVTEVEQRVKNPLTLWYLRSQVVLYIEDLQSDVEAVTNELKAHGVEVIAGHGRKLKKEVRRHKVSLVIVDHRIPGVASGFQTLREVREDIGGEIPVVCFSVHLGSLTESRDVARQYGENVHDFVRKPMQNGNLLNAICGVLWDNVRNEFRRTVREGLSIASPSVAQMREISRAEGQVVSIAKDICVVRFRSEKEEFRLQFPTRRVIKAGADNINCKVEHIVLEGGTQVISDLRRIGEQAHVELPVDELTPLPEDVEDSLKRAEEEEGVNEG